MYADLPHQYLINGEPILKSSLILYPLIKHQLKLIMEKKTKKKKIAFPPPRKIGNNEYSMLKTRKNEVKIGPRKKPLTFYSFIYYYFLKSHKIIAMTYFIPILHKHTLKHTPLHFINQIHNYPQNLIHGN